MLITEAHMGGHEMKGRSFTVLLCKTRFTANPNKLSIDLSISDNYL